MTSQIIVSGEFPKDSEPSTFMNNYGYGWFVKSKYQDKSINIMSNFEGEISGLKIELERRRDPIVFNRVYLKKEPTN